MSRPKGTSPPPSREVAVIGGGPAGLATTLRLLELGFRVTLLESSRYREPVVGEHLRPDALRLLDGLGVERAVWEANSLPCSEIHSAWGRQDLAVADYFFNPYGDSLVLARPGFDAALARVARERGARLLTGTRASGARWEGGLWKVGRVQGGQAVEAVAARFLVDATGRSGLLRRALEIGQRVEDRLVGIAAYVEIAGNGAAPRNLLLIEAGEDGWWYSARLPRGQLVATYMTDSDLLAGFPGGPLELWQDRLERSTHTRSRLKGHDPPATAYVRSAASRMLSRTVGDAWLAVGDAAMSFDPLSSQGISKGLEWGIRAAEAIAAATVGSRHEIVRYEADLRAAFAAYLGARRAYYRVERRWPDSPFWRRRHDEVRRGDRSGASPQLSGAGPAPGG